MQWYIWVPLAVLGFAVIMYLLSLPIAPCITFCVLLRRNSKKKWQRGPARHMDEIATQMYDTGVAWSEENLHRMRDVHIVSQGLNLWGEYYDFGSDRCVIILPGRREGLCGSYYFAIPYAQSGWNVLLIDPRAHGRSDGRYNTVGFEEYQDNMAWVEFLQKECGIRSVVFHGVCIGCAGGLLAAVHEQCPTALHGMVMDGMFENFALSSANHMKAYKIPALPGWSVAAIDFWMRCFTGHSMMVGPIDVIDRMQLPMLMLHSKEDLFSTPDQAQRLFERSGASQKKLVWFEKGYHSQLRYNDPQLYDSAIREFLQSLPTAEAKV